MTKKERKPLRKGAAISINILVTALLGLLYFFYALPAINLKDRNFYLFFFLLCIVYLLIAMVTSGFNVTGKPGVKDYFRFIKLQCMPIGIALILLLLIAVVGTAVSFPLFRAEAYRNLLTVTTGDFATDVDEISYNEIPMLDEDSAHRLGTTQMGTLPDMVSQFEVSDDYTQINYQGRPVRVAPLEYADLIKWLTNRAGGLPAYIIVDMVTQEVRVVRLPEGQGIKYSPSEPLFRNISRYLRIQYPTFMFESPTFEIDDEGNPWWVCPKVEMTIGLFGGKDINGAVLVNAITGEHHYYAKNEVPNWVDRVYLASLIMEQYDYHGTLVNGYLNSIFGQRDVTVTTEGYNYIALNDDVYMYTGITSVSSDQSNLGFLLCNQRTKETRFYVAPGATEESARASAEGKVQHLQYRSTFPLLLNISGEPTYFIALKDASQLVKMYAMVNVGQYQLVGTGENLAACERAYISLLTESGITKPTERLETEVSGIIAEIRTAVIEGNSYYFLRLEDNPVFYSLSAADNTIVVTLNVGDRVAIDHIPVKEGEILPILDGYTVVKR